MDYNKPATILLILVVLTGFGLSADLQISAQVNKTSLSMNDVVKYTLKIEGERNVEVPRPNFQGLQIRSGPSQSSQIQIINGEINASKTISWWLSPLKTGKIEIAPVTVKHKGNSYSSQTITLNVTGQSSQQQTQNQQTQNQQNQNKPDENQDPVIFRAEPEKSEVYNGEQLNVDFVLYFRTRIRNFSRIKLPQAKNFWIEEFESPRQPKVEQVNIKGQQYNRAVIQKIAFFPTKAGQLEIDPMEIKIEVSDPRERRNRLDDFFNDPFFDDPFFSRTKVVSLSSPSEKINVKPLPDKPDNFSGGVGDYAISAQIDTTQITENEAFSISYKVQGLGNINSISLHNPELALNCEVFEPKINRKSKNIGDHVHGILDYKYVIIPREPGDLEIPSYDFTYFDVEKGQYVTKSTKSFQVKVEAGPDNINVDESAYSRDEIAMLKKDIRYINTDSESWRIQGQTFYDHFWFWLINFLSAGIVVGALIYRYRMNKYQGNKGLVRRKKAGSNSREHLNLAENSLKDEKFEQVAHHLYSALAGYIADRSGLPESGTDVKTIKQQLKQAGAENGIVKDVEQLLKTLEIKKYAPESISHKEARKLLQQTRELAGKVKKII